MTSNTTTGTQPGFWDAPEDGRKGRSADQAERSHCALCKAPPASSLGLCRDCLGAAVAEHGRLFPRPADPLDSRPSSIPFSALCPRCGRPHNRTECDA